jgi:hypothetical protein
MVLGVGVKGVGAARGAEVVVTLAVSAMRGGLTGSTAMPKTGSTTVACAWPAARNGPVSKTSSDDVPCPPRTVFHSLTSTAVASGLLSTVSW